MVQANGVQREPSMEEILASIRRIIEDSDTTRKADELPSPAPQPASSVDVAAFRAEFQGEPADERRADSAGEKNAPPSSASLDKEETPRSGIEAEAASEAAGDDVGGDIEMDFAFEDEEVDVPDMPAPGAVNGAAAAVPSQPASPSASDMRGGAVVSSTILSPHIGNQVAASFGELSEAMEARSRRSFDEIAEEMLRPMLREWLDDNLPHLVEKLVREEIERIARGGAAPR